MVETARPIVNAEFHSPKEQEPIPERFYLPQADIITVSGPHYVYKTSAAKVIAGKDSDPRNSEIQERLKVSGLDIRTVGELVRIETELETGKPFLESFTYPEERDRFQDSTMEQIMREVRIPKIIVNPDGEVIQHVQNPVEVEARYAGFFGAKVSKELAGRRYAPNIERVLFYCSDTQEMLTRAVKRDQDKNPDLSPEEIMELAISRDLDVNRKSDYLYHELVLGQNIFSPDMKTPDGDDVYTIKIDTAGLEPHEVFAQYHAQLLLRKALREVKRAEFSNTQEGKASFELISSLVTCEALVQEHKCNRYGVQTVDLYIGDKVIEQTPACATNDHANKIKRKLRSAFASGISISMNGFKTN